MKADLHWQAAIVTKIVVLGHAPVNELCVAMSCLLRSCAQAMENLQTTNDLDWVLTLPQEGQFAWQLYSWHKRLSPVLEGISLVLANGVRSLAEDYPVLELSEQKSQFVYNL